ncbi:unnamed protein product [Porites evermanni]|uniref:Uncharacterized protein n=1 Tax=Porites evermanni TaxID=104178 RepID=A0ABN8QIB4_9CNID|nr:unnamed protein product [Porites evermanni]
MKEFIANRKLTPPISFLEKVLGISHLKHFFHHSQGSVREIYLTLGDTKNDLPSQNVLKDVLSCNSEAITGLVRKDLAG